VFRWRDAELTQTLGQVRHEQGLLIGRAEAIGFLLRERASLDMLTRDASKTSEIEGQQLDMGSVRSSIARKLGLDIGALAPSDRHIDGLVDMILDATVNYAEPLTKDRLCGWQAALFPSGRSGIERIRVGEWRDDAGGPMQVVSGAMGRERVHYQAPPAAALDEHMQAFCDWFNSPPRTDPVVQAGLAHLWFVSIHPFDDGNGRIARAVADMLLARSEASSQRFYSMSAQIRVERSAYYALLEQTQRGGLDITAWLAWFLACLHRAIVAARSDLAAVLGKAEFWAQHANTPLNPRQTKVLNLMLDGLVDTLTSSKWAKLCKCSQDTAGRDITELLGLGILRKGPGGGRSSSYALVGNRQTETSSRTRSTSTPSRSKPPRLK
jgi:Fic family protein